MKEKDDIIVVPLDGGPCSGKTTGLNYAFEKLTNSGIAVATTPEAATLLINHFGMKPPEIIEKYGREAFFNFECAMIDMQFYLEDRVFKPLLNIKKGRKKILIPDRACISAFAYMTEEEQARYLKLRGLKKSDLREKRYGGGIFLVTAAYGKEKFYTLENNEARFEKTLDEARAADDRSKKIWVGHPHLRVIDNSTLFRGKMRRMLAEIQRIIGVPVVLEIEKKFLLRSQVDHTSLPVHCEHFVIEQAYMAQHDGWESRARKRTQGNDSVYYQTFKTHITEGAREEREERISSSKFYSLLKTRSPIHDTLKKIRTCFLSDNQYFELDTFLEPKRLHGLQILEIEVTEENSKVSISKWLGRTKEVTKDPRYENYTLSLR
ncbi:AAA family ATPase [Candidatus Giovannonibacteria bacterium]|nr:AAA family ATPase [Candidatus Giovannonibacteria bacterium]